MPKIKDITVTDYCNDIDQIGIICADMEKAQRAMLDVCGLVPEVNYEKLYDLLYRGEAVQAQAKVCSYNYLNVDLEFIQPIGEGRTAWHDYLDMGQSGLHHVRFNVENYEIAKQSLLDKGLEIWIEGDGTGLPGLKYAYFDGLDTLGYVIEIINWKEVS